MRLDFESLLSRERHIVKLLEPSLGIDSIKSTRLIKREHLFLNIGTSLATIVVNCSLEEVFWHRGSNRNILHKGAKEHKL